MAFTPLHDRVRVRRVESEEKTAGGLIIPDSAKEKPAEGIIVAVGAGAMIAAETYRAQRESTAETTERRRKLLQNLNAMRAGLESVSAKVGKAEREVAVAEDRRTQALPPGTIARLEDAVTRAGFDIIETGDYPNRPASRFIVARKPA